MTRKISHAVAQFLIVVAVCGGLGLASPATGASAPYGANASWSKKISTHCRLLVVCGNRLDYISARGSGSIQFDSITVDLSVYRAGRSIPGDLVYSKRKTFRNVSEGTVTWNAPKNTPSGIFNVYARVTFREGKRTIRLDSSGHVSLAALARSR